MNASVATWWPIFNWCKFKNTIQVKVSIPWVRCASGNVSSSGQIAVGCHSGEVAVYRLLKLIIRMFLINIKMMIRVDREGEAEVCSERDTHHPVAALAWLTIILIVMEIIMELMKTMVMKMKMTEKIK